jgi:hypothetical protein
MRKGIDWKYVWLMVICTLLGVPLAWAISLPPMKIGGDIADQLPAWAQAILTAGTFAIAMWHQEKMRAETEAQRRADAIFQKEERNRQAHIRALAYAVNIRNELTGLLSIGQTFQTFEFGSTQDTFSAAASFLDIRHRAIEATELLDASMRVLRAVNAAQALYADLDSFTHKSEYSTEDVARLRERAANIEGIATRAIASVDIFLEEVTSTE